MSSHLPSGEHLDLGAATASYQVEGATGEDGRGPSIWDTFSARPGAIVDGSDGSVACDSYHRVGEDADLVAGLGVEWYRFSLAWPRIVPAGSGRAEPRGLAYYDRLVDALLEREVTPMATLYHWDLPQPLEGAGGWLARDTAERFAEYAMVAHGALGDRVNVWATHNEPWCAAYLGYAGGVHAPGRREGGAAHRAAHHLLLGHALAAAAMRESGATDVGIVLNLAPIWPERAEAAEVSDAVDAIRNRVWLGPLVDGAYDDALLAVASPLADPEVVREGDLDLVQGSADWLGINYYTPVRPDVPTPGEGPESHHEAGAFPGAPPVAFRPRPPLTAMGWEVEPEGLTELLVQTHERTGLPLLVTENGAAYDEVPGDDGVVHDDARIGYLRSHLAATEAARTRGADIRAYIAWTLLDNFEWAEGYTKTFGLVHVEPADQTRTPKDSYRWFAEYARSSRAGPRHGDC